MILNVSAIPRDSAIGRALRAPLALLPRNLVVPVLQGPLRGSRWIIGSVTNGCWLGSYEHATQRILASVIREGTTVFDVGANVGFFTLLASRRVGLAGHVHAFERVPRNIAYLVRHLELNGVANVAVVESAVSGHHGQARSATTNGPSMASLRQDGDIAVCPR